MIPGLEGFPEARDAAVLLPFDFLGSLVDTLFQQPGRGGGAFGGAAEFDFLDYGAAVVVGGYYAGDAGL